ncbi:anti-sigma factor family protein [Xanthomonas bundabergensis]|uniref:anti-sigma factor family protein n=1 Tax=Xanthomonas bundabergensis TaxID=3160842 RepID=UPI003515CF3F
MSDIDASTLQAYADGELDALQAARVEAALRADPQLAAALQRLQRLQARLRAGFAPVLDEAVPPRLLAAARSRPAPRADPPADATAEPAVASLPLPVTSRAHRARQRPTRRWGWPAAVAAALLLGVWITQRQMPQPAAPAAARGSAASGELAHALDQQLSGGADTGVRIGLSFRDRDGRYCRTFALRAGSAGLACQRDGRWQVQMQVPAPAPDGAAVDAGLRMAASAMPAAVLQAVDARIEGQALDADGERRARARGWR